MKLRLAVVLATCVLIVQSAFAVSNTVVISQVYGGGGNVGATLKNDFIELYNRGTTTVTLAGWSVQYGSTGGTSWSNITPLSGSIAPGHYYLIQEAAGTGGTVNLPTPDATGSIAMAAGAGKVALVNSTTALTGTGCPLGASVVDFVGYGGANCSEGATTATLTNTTAALRINNGCTDTDNNSTDFSVGTPNPRNSSSTNTCGNNPPTITAPADPIKIVDQDAAPFTVNLTGNDDGGIYNWSATPGAGVAAVSVSGGQGTATATFTVTLQAGFSGIAKFTASLSDNVNTPATTQLVNIKVNAPAVNNPPSITAPANPITSVAQNAAPFTVNLTGSDDGSVYNWSATPGTGIATVSVTAGQGTATATFTVTLQTGFNGTATFTASLTDNVNAPVTQLVNIAVVPPPDHLVISQIYGGGGNAGAPYKNDYVQLYNPTTSPVDITGWTLQYASATGNSWTNNQPLGGVIGANEYYLVALGSGGSAGLDLPAANISGSINMSQASGKIVLVRNGVPLSGICPLIGPPADPDVVDFLGYGTANCSEGNSNAPGLSVSTALFRKNGGNTDSNNNLNDFTAGAPNPFRTTPLQELGPWISNTDPRLDGTNSPYDSSITVDFSEPVDVVGTWFDVTCASGQHNVGTVAHTSDFKEYVITPNTSFQFGEQCTVTIFKNGVHDQDLDDSAPNTDTLAADYSWSFTVVAAGQPAPYPPSVHLTMGNPTDATADVTLPINYLMEKPTYALSYNRSKGMPNWVSWHLDTSWFGGLARVDTFRPDPAIPPDWYRVQAFDFFTTGFDRGHMCPNADRNNLNRIPINQETYLMGSNMVPQAPANNEGPWADLESYLRSILTVGGQDYEMYVVSGPAGVGGTGSNGFATTLANGHVTVPAYTWKVALVLPKGDNDVSRVTAATRTIAVIMPNTQTLDPDWKKHLTRVDAVEALCDCNLFSNLPEIIQNSIEAGVDGVNPPGVANQSTSTHEDVAAPITLNAVSPDPGATFIYTITQPAHGTLSGSGAARTYTPAPDFNGNDSFTFSVNDGHANSNTATVNISVLEVNDAPSAANDAKSTDEDTTLAFPASDLTTNDSAGPANESGQTLTVTGVTSTADTHGTLTLIGGQVTYAPEANYNGAASFSYQVCDNGITAGLSDALCATATVNVMVNPVNDPPTLAPIGNKTVEVGNTLAFTAVGSDIDSPTLTYSLGATAPAGATISAATGAFTWTPSAVQAGLTFTFDVIVSDGLLAASTPVAVNVTDTSPPAISNYSLSATELWPANHQMVDVTVAYNVFDFGDTAPACSIVVSSNEPLNGTGDGDTAPDWEVVDAHHVRLRAERAGSGTGRIYAIETDCRDRFGNLAHTNGFVTVPKSKGR